MNINDLTLFERRVFALEKAKKKARNPEWKKLWEQKLGELKRNEKTRLISL
jgi:hypothetical protein